MAIEDKLNLPTMAQFAELLTVNKAMVNGLADIAKMERPFIDVREWRTVQSLVRLGLAPQFFQVGDILSCSHDVFGQGEVKTFEWDVIGFDQEIPCDVNGTPITIVDNYGNTIPAHSMTLAAHYVLNVRVKWGTDSSIWNDSYMKEWLNSDDYVYNAHSSMKGFMYGLDSDLSAVLGNVLKTSVVSGGMREYKEKIFVPSTTEVYGDDVTLDYRTYLKEGTMILSKDTEAISEKRYYSKNSDGLFTEEVNPSGSPVSLGLYESIGAYSFFKPPRSDNENPTNSEDTNRVKSTYSGNLMTITPTRSHTNSRNLYSIYSRADGWGNGLISAGSRSAGDSFKSTTFQITPYCVVV